MSRLSLGTVAVLVVVAGAFPAIGGLCLYLGNTRVASDSVSVLTLAAEKDTMSPERGAAVGPAVPLSESECLRAENQQLRLQLKALEEERESLRDENFRSRLSQFLSSVCDEQRPTHDARERWEKGIEQVRLEEQCGVLPGVDPDISFIRLIVDMLALGDPGIQYMMDIVADPAEDSEVREGILFFLQYYPHRLVLSLFVELTNSELISQRDRLNAILTQTALLDESDIRPVVSALLREFRSSFAEWTSRDDGVSILATLALHHKDSEALRLLSDARVAQGNVNGALRVADFVHSNEARSFVERVRHWNADEDSQRSAREILARW